MPTYKTQGTLTTAVKSFSEPQQPNRLDGLSYSLNGQSITVDVIGSPSTASEEVKTVSLGGASGYDLSWSSAHSDFQLEITLSTSDTSQTPSFDAVSVSAYPPNAPSVSLSYIADDQLDFSFDADTSAGSIDSFEVEVLRDNGSWVSPSGGPSSFTHDGSSSYTKSYGPSSDNSYGSQVGVDSSFQFRVRATNSAGSSNWATSGTVYTTPVPPHNPSVNRPDANTITLTAGQKSDTATYVIVEYREDTGDGYGSWSLFDGAFELDGGTDDPQSFMGKGTISWSISVGETPYYGDPLKEDARYQFRWQTRTAPNTYAIHSHRVYADYGNEGNVYFSDDFESGDLSAWGDTSGGTVTDGSTNPVDGPDEGSYRLSLGGAEYVETPPLDLTTTDTSVLVKGAFAISMSSDSDTAASTVTASDGTTTETLQSIGWSYHEQGWVEFAAIVPSSVVSNSTTIRFEADSVIFTDFDRVVVSDILHEYTTPAAPSNLTVDGGNRELSASWTSNSSLAGANAHFQEYRQRVTDSGDALSKTNVEEATSYTSTASLDGEQYDVRVDSLFHQHRRGETYMWWRSSSSLKTATTVLPPPLDLTHPTITPSSADLDWVNPENNATEKRVYLRQTDSRTGMDFNATNTDYVGTRLNYDSTRNHGLSYGFWMYDGSGSDSGARLFSTDLSEYWGAYQPNGNGDLEMLFTDPSEAGHSLSATPPSGSWAHYFFVFDASSGDYYLYEDGSQNASDTSSQTSWGTGNFKRYANIGTGAESDSFNIDQSNAYFDGRIADLRVHHTALSASQVNDIYNGVFVTDSLVGYWPLDLIQNGVTPDLSEYSNDGQVNGPTLTGPTVQDASGALASNATSYTLSNLLNGEEYDAYLHTLTDHNEVRSRR